MKKVLAGLVVAIAAATAPSFSDAIPVRAVTACVEYGGPSGQLNAWNWFDGAQQNYGGYWNIFGIDYDVEIIPQMGIYPYVDASGCHIYVALTYKYRLTATLEQITYTNVAVRGWYNNAYNGTLGQMQAAQRWPGHAPSGFGTWDGQTDTWVWGPTQPMNMSWQVGFDDYGTSLQLPPPEGVNPAPYVHWNCSPGYNCNSN